MVKAYIIGGSRPVAGELIRILVNHPDVEIKHIYEPKCVGQDISSVHHGLIGESLPEFSDIIPESMRGVFFVCDSSEFSNEIVVQSDTDLKIIDLTHGCLSGNEGFVYGLPEIFRKPLVRGATKAVIPNPAASLLLTSLYPMASHLLLNGDIDVEIQAPAWMCSPESADRMTDEVEMVLTDVQRSWSGKINVSSSDSGTDRGLRVKLDIPCTILTEDLRGIYSEMYDDHNFTFITDRPCEMKEVIGTDKCIVALYRENAGSISIDAIADARMRGGAGEAVHVMNLLLGLHERVGLNLKVSEY